MLKPEGRLFLSTSNRLCPIDIGHGHHYNKITDFFVQKTGVPLTIPWHKRNFVLSYNDIHRLLLATKYYDSFEMRKATASGYLSFSKTENHLIKSIVEKYLRIVDMSFLRTSPLNPLLLIEIVKAN